jgi:hypothetical protein
MAEILATIPTQDFTDVFIASEAKYPNPLSLPNAPGIPNLYFFMGGVWKDFSAVITEKPQWVTMGQDNVCYNSANSDTTKVSTIRIPVCLFKSYASICPADFYNLACGPRVGASFSQMVNMMPQQQRGAISNPLIAMTLLALQNHTSQAQDDFIKHIVFGSKLWSSRTTTPIGSGGTRGFLFGMSSPAKVSEKYEVNFINETLGKCDSLWGQLVAGTTETDPRKKVKFVASNDGTAVGNALNPLYTIRYIRRLINEIEAPYNNQPERCVIQIDPAIFRSLNVAIEKQFTGTSEGVQKFTAGDFNFVRVGGFMVVPFTASELFDMDNDAMIQTNIPEMGGLITHSANLRGMVLVEENLAIGMDGDSTSAGDSGAVMTMAPSTDQREDGNFIIKGGYFAGIGIIEPRYCVVSYSNSNTYAI